MISVVEERRRGEKMKEICDNCHYCIEKSNKNKGAELHTIHFKCILPEEKNVNPDDGCDKWTQRSGKRKIRYKDGEIGEVEEDE